MTLQQDLAARMRPEQQQQLRRLTRVQHIAWPTVTMFGVLVVGIITSDVLAVVGVIPLWLGMLINSVVGYLAFSVVHDAIHRSVSSNRQLNDWIGQIAVLMVVSYVHLGLFRWGHSQHHRFAVGPRDPDRVFRGPWWQLPFRWAFIDVAYLVHVVRHGDARAHGYLRKSLMMAAVAAATVIVLLIAGYGMEVLMLWFIPSRLVQMALGFSFFWLPHAPHDVSQADNFTRASTVREGHEAFMDIALQYQNYHLVHHLFPTTPFYNNGRVWRLLQPVMDDCELAIQRGFAIRPEIRPARS